MADEREPRPVGELLKKARVAKGLKANRAGAVLGVGDSTYRSWENGSHAPLRAENLRSILLGFGIKIVPMAVWATDEEIAEAAEKHPDDAQRINRLAEDLRSTARQATPEHDQSQ